MNWVLGFRIHEEHLKNMRRCAHESPVAVWKSFAFLQPRCKATDFLGLFLFLQYKPSQNYVLLNSLRSMVLEGCNSV